MKSLRWRLLFIAALAVFSIYILIPTGIYMSQPADLRNDQEHMKKIMPRWLPSGHLNLGLDLQGGVQLVLGVNLFRVPERACMSGYLLFIDVAAPRSELLTCILMNL